MHSCTKRLHSLRVVQNVSQNVCAMLDFPLFDIHAKQQQFKAKISEGGRKKSLCLITILIMTSFSANYAIQTRAIT